MGLLNTIKPAVQYFLFHKNSSGKVCASFQCEDAQVGMHACVRMLGCRVGCMYSCRVAAVRVAVH